MLGLGLGWFTASLLILLGNPGGMTDYQIESKARELGMVYAQEVLVLKEDQGADQQQEESGAEGDLEEDVASE